MKKNLSIFLVLFCLLYFYNVKADDFLKDGWHLLPSATDINKKEWAYYQNNEEKLRYSKMIYIHGGWNTTPENSIASLEALKNNGYYALTIDINFTKDNIPVLIHDDTINWAARNPDLSPIKDKLYVKNLTLDQLKQYAFVVNSKGVVLPNYQGNKITTFEEALVYCKNNGLTLEVEIKEGTQSQIQSMIHLTKKYDMDGVIKWTSFNPVHLSYINQFDENEMLQLLTFDNNINKIDQAYNNYNLKTGNNTLIYNENDSYYSVQDMPEEQNNYRMSNYVLKTIPKANIILSKNNIDIRRDKEEKIPYEYNGDGKLKCQSDNESIIKCNIDQDNKQIIISTSSNQFTSVTLSLWSTQGIKYSASNKEKLVINNLEILPTSIILSENSMILNVGNQKILNATIEPNDADNKEIFWSSDNPQIVTVNEGIITARQPGTATIIVKTINNKYASCVVDVKGNQNISTNIITAILIILCIFFIIGIFIEILKKLKRKKFQ